MSSNKSLPILCICPFPHHWESNGAWTGESAGGMKVDAEAAVRNGIFSRFVKGYSVAEFASLKQELIVSGSDEEIVLLVGGPNSHEVIKDIIVWPMNGDIQRSRVKWIHTMFTGVDTLVLPILRPMLEKYNIKLSNARGVYSVMLAEHVMLSTLFFNRQVARLLRNRSDKNYDRFSSLTNFGQSMVIIGYGNIGREVARTAIAGFRMNVVGLRRTISDTKDDLGVQQISITSTAEVYEALYSADFVVNILPLTKETYRFVDNTRVFSRMSPKGVFVNIGRGPTVNEPDLVEALKSNLIKGAALDVFEEEPLPADSPLWNTADIPDSKIFITPHNADVSPTSFAESWSNFFRKLAKHYVHDSKFPEYCVDLDAGY